MIGIAPKPAGAQPAALPGLIWVFSDFFPNPVEVVL